MPTVRFQLRRDTAANWTSVNPTLADGEPAVETDTQRQKLGNGVTPWNSLAYVADGTVKSVAGASSASGFELTGGPITSTGTLTFGISSQVNARAALGAVGLAGNETIAGSKTFSSTVIAAGVVIGASVTVPVAGASSPALSQAGSNLNSITQTLGAWLASTVGPNHCLYKSRSTTVGVFSAVQSGDLLGTYRINGDDGTAIQNGASLSAVATENWSTSGTGTRFRSFGSAVGSTVQSELLGWQAGIGVTFGGSANVFLDANRILRNRTYTVTAAPSPTGIAGAQFYCTNPTAGQARPYWSNGTEWRDATGTLLA